jgi:hypothetical protein
MNEIWLSQKKYQELIKRLDEIKKDVNSIRLKAGLKGNLIDRCDLKQLFHLSPRTVARLHESGKLPHMKIGRKFYYEVDTIWECFKVHQDSEPEDDQPPSQSVEAIDEDNEISCLRCPLFVIFNS